MFAVCFTKELDATREPGLPYFPLITLKWVLEVLIYSPMVVLKFYSSAGEKVVLKVHLKVRNSAHGRS